jgi:putative oxidoreductase
MDLKKLCCCDCGTAYSDVTYALMRVALGAIFVFHGYQKVAVMGMDGVAGFLGSLGFPMATMFAYILSYGELVAGLMLIVGLYTHWAAKFALVVGIVAWAFVHLANGFDARTGGYEFIMLITAVSLAVMTHGAGKYSVDQMYAGKVPHMHK